MCGIGGIIAGHPLSAEIIERTRQGIESLHHRGPDGFGEFSEGQTAGQSNSHVYFGMRRLSIIDLKGGWQPLFNEDQSLALVCNGEIYNHHELRQQLEARGHQFKTGSDCEVIVHLYEEYGLDFLKHLRGMFALALWDSLARRLILARDRLGEKPLYLYETEGRLLFSSEAKGLLTTGMVPFELDPEGVDLYLHYLWVPEPKTAIRGVRKLPAGHFLIIEPEPFRITEHCYWQLGDAPPLDCNPEEAIAAEMARVAELITRSDVPVGVALSAGFDSSAIAAIVAARYPGNLQAFTVGYEGQAASDERREARAFARQLDIPFHDIEIGISDMVRDFRQLNRDRDDPIADISGYGYYSIARAARAQGCPVLLQGQGADELDFGYPWAVKAEHRLQRAGTGHQGWLEELSGLKAPHRNPKETLEILGGLGHGWLTPPQNLSQPYQITRAYRMGDYLQSRIYGPGIKDTLKRHDASKAFPRNDNLTDTKLWIIDCLLQGYLRENGMAQGDRLSSAHSIELRLPFCDYRLVETIAGLRKHHRNAGLQPKHWLKGALGKLLPDWVLKRPKTGFTPPTLAWYRALQTTYGADLLEGHLVNTGILTRTAAEYFLKPGASRLSPWFQLRFAAEVLEIWAQEMQKIAEGSASHRPLATTNCAAVSGTERNGLIQ